MSNLPKVNMKVTVVLPLSGIPVTIRKISHSAVSLSAQELVMASSTLIEVAAEHAHTGEELLDSVQKDPTPARQPDIVAQLQDPLHQIRLTLGYQKALVKASIVSPPFADLLEAYEGSEDLADFGLASDFDFLLSAAKTHNGIQDGMTKEESKRFPGP